MSRFSKVYKLFFLLLVSCTALKAEVLHFFDPCGRESGADTVYFKGQYFIADDPVSLRQLFKKWRDPYHPKKGDNLALQDARLDLGMGFANGYYVGYFYRYNAFIRTNRDFTDFYHTVKNKLPFDSSRTYNLQLNIQGIKENGLVVSADNTLFEDENSKVQAGVALSLSAGYAMQDGSISGTAHILDRKTYTINARSRYHYTHNYLYHLDVEDADGFGFGTDFSLAWYLKAWQFAAKLVVNDLYSRIYWHNLPYSFVNIATDNRSYDEEGYVRYAPTINGLEKYVDFTQKIEPRYRLVMSKNFAGDLRLTAGAGYSYKKLFPFVHAGKLFYGKHYIGMTYESRFETIGLEYSSKNFFAGLSSDALHDIGAFGANCGLRYRF